ncbi:MAG: hypothetical protein J7L66_00715 [Anaerolineaceae bacterium]|nr:hypothetical protein [Anaerolineaceae bacterium]
MKCSNCYYENKNGQNMCKNCNLKLHSPGERKNEKLYIIPRTGSRQISRPFTFLWRLIASLFNFILYIIVLIICLGAILGVLVYQCRVNIPVHPDWDFLPNVVANYWNWADEWQMNRCPKLTEKNYLFGDEPIPKFDGEGELIVTPECGNASITFAQWSAPAGTTFKISLDGFPPNETIHCCWYFPSSVLVNCTDLEADKNGHRDTVYWSSDQDPKGKYRMEAQGGCANAIVEWTIE